MTATFPDPPGMVVTVAWRRGTGNTCTSVAVRYGIAIVAAWGRRFGSLSCAISNAEIMRRVAEGVSFTVTVHGRAVADLVPHQRGRPRRSLVPAAEFDELIAAAGPGSDVAQWTRDMAGSDELFGDDDPVDPWERGRAR